LKFPSDNRLHTALRRLCALLLCCLCAGSSSALAARSERDTNGFKMGPARLHPSFRFTTRYDSAAAQLTSTQSAGDLVLRFRPGVAFELPGARFEMRLSGAVDYAHYLGLDYAGSKDASHLGANALLDLKVKPVQSLTLALGDSLRRSDESNSPTLQIGVLSLHNDASLRARWRPGHGTLSIEPSYHLVSEVFSKRSDFDNLACEEGFGCTGWDVGESNYLNHAVALGLRWDFLPKSALLLDAGFRMRRYLGVNGVDSDSVVASIGFFSVFLPRLTAQAAFGWAHELNGVYSSPVARLSLSYALTLQSKLTLGYERAFSPTPGLKWIAYGSDRVYLNAGLLLAGRFWLDADLSANFLGYRADSDTLSTWRIAAALKGTYEILSWLSVGLSYRFSYDEQLSGIDDFMRHDVSFFVELSY